MKLTDAQWTALKQAVLDNDRERFEELIYRHAEQAVRDEIGTRARRAVSTMPGGQPYLACYR